MGRTRSIVAAIAFQSFADAFTPHSGLKWRNPDTLLKSASTAEAESTTSIPKLPPDALILTSSDEATWDLEKKEYKMLSEDDAKSSFAPLLASFQLKDRFYHAFEALGQPLKKSDFNEVFAKGDGLGGRVSQPVSDAVRLALLKDLVDGLVWCHLQGTPHLRLDSDTVRLHKTPPSQGRRFGEWRANLVGIGTGAQLATRKTPYQVGNESWAFNPPETLTGALIKGNLPGLYAWDSWSLGVLASMVCGGYTWSPFAAEADLADLTFSTQAAVALKIKRELGDFSGFLTKLNRDGDGFLFRYGWVVEMLVGLLKPDSSERLSAVQAREIMEAGLAQRLTAQTKDKKAKARAARAQQQGAQGGKAAELEGRVLSAGDMQKVKLAFEAFDVDGTTKVPPPCKSREVTL